MAGVYEPLSEQECYLYAILQDYSGLDIAEFCLLDEEFEDGLVRAFDFQWPWWRDGTKHQVDQGSRSVGKSMSIRYRAISFAFCMPGSEMLITAPEAIHLQAITDKIETIFRRNRLPREMIATRGNQPLISKRPFNITFKNGGRIMGRIPQRDGSGVKGVHPAWLEQDEAQDYPEAGWTELNSTIQKIDKASWRAHGVTKGIGGTFDKHCQPDSGWRVHRLPAMYRPTWDDVERQENIMKYLSEDNVDYRRNILGLPGDSSSALFVLHRLMKNVDTELSSEYNEDIYTYIKIDDSMIEESGDPLILLNMPASHNQYKNFWIGADIGWTTSPTAICVFAEERHGKEPSHLRLLTRLLLSRVSGPDQLRIFVHLADLYRPQAIALDSTGAGQPLVQFLQDEVRRNPDVKLVLDRIKGYNFSSNIVVDFDERVEIDENDPNGWKEAQITRNVKDYSSDLLREFVDNYRLHLPFDKDLIKEFQGETWTYSKSMIDHYGRRKVFSGTGAHSLDACRMAALAFHQNPIDQFIKNHEDNWEPPPMIFM
jgi:hypothetical protein